ncbi:FAFR299Wp [Eremothecium gossypii FDAG1]|nr:FAFR299Wp [Eremothecium gossypii FDAG1]
MFKTGISVFRSRVLARGIAQCRVGSRAASTAAETVLKDGAKPMRIDRELPDPYKDRFKQRATFAVFATATTAALLLIFNYEKVQSPVVTNTMYQMRRLGVVRELLGDNLEFGGLLGWVHGELNQVAGRVNVRFTLKGSKGVPGEVRLVADRENRQQQFLIREWTVTIDGKTVDLLADGAVRTLET